MNTLLEDWIRAHSALLQVHLGICAVLAEAPDEPDTRFERLTAAQARAAFLRTEADASLQRAIDAYEPRGANTIRPIALRAVPRRLTA